VHFLVVFAKVGRCRLSIPKRVIGPSFHEGRTRARQRGFRLQVLLYLGRAGRLADRPFADFRTGPSQRTVVAPAISSATRTQKLSFNTRTSPRAINRPLT